MKKFFCLFLLFILITFSVAIAENENTAIPESFDYESLSAQYDTEEDEMEAVSFIYYSYYHRYTGQVKNSIIDSHLKTGYTCSISPNVLVARVGTKDELPMFRILVQYSGKKALNMNECIFKVGNKRYKFEVLNQKGTGIICIGIESTEFMEALCSAKNKGESVSLRMSGNGYYDFDITPNIGYITELYESFVACGGTNEKYLRRISDQLIDSY